MPTTEGGGVTVLDFLQFRGEVKSATPATDHVFVEVTFGTAGADKDIKHTLSPANPESIYYTVVKADRAVSIYHDQSGTRRHWGVGYVVLRASVDSAKVTLLLFTPRS